MELTIQRKFSKRGSGLASSLFTGASKILGKIPVGAVINSVVDALPVELHLPGGYQYCGPGTNLKQRLSRGDPGINKLDQACREHDISYSKYSDTDNRAVADRLLARKAWERVKSGDANLGEKAAALAVATAMKTKTAVGGGGRRRRQVKRKRGRKRGGNLNKKRRVNKKKRSVKRSVWSMVKAGQGLYLKPYQRV